MDLPALETAIKILEKSLDSLGVWLAVWTALVVVGLIVEFAEDVKELITERPFKWRLFRTMVGGFLITVGVGGELFIQFRASKIETDLRTDSHQVEALLNKQAADANKEAGDARREAADAVKGTAKSLAEAATANERASQANRVAEELRQKNLQLEKEFAPRLLAIRGLPDGKSNIDELKKFAGTKVILASVHDAEALHAAGSIKWLLEKAGWDVVVTVPIDPFSASVKIPDGVTLIPAREGDAPSRHDCPYGPGMEGS